MPIYVSFWKSIERISGLAKNMHGKVILIDEECTCMFTKVSVLAVHHEGNIGWIVQSNCPRSSLYTDHKQRSSRGQAQDEKSIVI